MSTPTGPVPALEIRTHPAGDLHMTVACYERRGLRPVRFGITPPPEGEPDVLYGWRKHEP